MNLIRSIIAPLALVCGQTMAQFDGMMGFDAPSTMSVTSAASVQSYQPGKSFYVALKGEISSPWHAYWQNPGTVGEAMSAEISAPEGFTVKERDGEYYPQEEDSRFASTASLAERLQAATFATNSVSHHEDEVPISRYAILFHHVFLSPSV